MGSLCKFAQKCGLSGLEFAWGIPGTVGGALFMNAGAYGGEMKDVVYSVSHITQNGDIGRTEAENLEFGYRTSVYRKNGCIITGAVFKLKKDDPEEIQNRMNDYMNRRSTKQPLEYCLIHGINMNLFHITADGIELVNASADHNCLALGEITMTIVSRDALKQE